MKLRFEGSTITGLVDGKPLLTVTDNLYSHGMAGLLAGSGPKLSTPYYDNLVVKGLAEPMPQPAALIKGQSPIYGNPKSN